MVTGAISGEYAPGQFEINLQHSDNPLQAADHCVMFRRAVQGVAKKHGYRATFMAKPHLENAGSGLHLHVSLLNDRGENVFSGPGEYGNPDCGSKYLSHSIAGLTKHHGDCMGIFAPNCNSYHRYVPNLFVPVSPSWGYENRSVAIRIPKSPPESRRLEHRVSGADANPYLTLAAILAAIHDGIVTESDPGQPAQGNAGEQVDPSIPVDLESAMEKMTNSELLRQYFGQRYVEAYTCCKLKERDAFLQTAQAEHEWYL